MNDVGKWRNALMDRARDDAGLSDAAFRVLHYLLHKRLNTSTEPGRCDPGQEKIAADLKRSARCVRRALSDLEERGYIERKRRGPRATTAYYFSGFDRTKMATQDRTDLAGQGSDRTILAGADRTDSSASDRTKMADKLLQVEPLQVEPKDSTASTRCEVGKPAVDDFEKCRPIISALVRALYPPANFPRPDRAGVERFVRSALDTGHSVAAIRETADAMIAKALDDEEIHKPAALFARILGDVQRRGASAKRPTIPAGAIRIGDGPNDYISRW